MQEQHARGLARHVLMNGNDIDSGCTHALEHGLQFAFVHGGRAADHPVDYAFYLEGQLQPVADAILAMLGDDFETVTSGQARLF